jgi:hypothetical protein
MFGFDIGALLNAMGSGPVGATSPMAGYGMGHDPSGGMPLQAGNTAQPAPWMPDATTLAGAALTQFPPVPKPLPQGQPRAVDQISSQSRAPGAPLVIAPQAEPTPVGSTGAAAPVAGAQKPMADRITEALKGVKAPASPELQRISTPAAPRPTAAIKGGELLALLAAMQGQGVGPTLGSALK